MGPYTFDSGATGLDGGPLVLLVFWGRDFDEEHRAWVVCKACVH